MTSKYINAKDAVRANELFLEGKSQREIAKILGVNEPFTQALIERGDVMRCSYELRSQNLGWQEVAERVGVSYEIAQRLGHQYGVITHKPKLPQWVTKSEASVVYDLAKKGFSPTLIKAMGHEYNETKLNAWCNYHHRPKVSQLVVLKADARWDHLTTLKPAMWSDYKSCELLERLEGKGQHWTITSHEEEGRVSIRLTAWAGVAPFDEEGKLMPSKQPTSPEAGIWELTASEQEEDRKQPRLRPFWSTALDAVMLRMYELKTMENVEPLKLIPKEALEVALPQEKKPSKEHEEKAGVLQRVLQLAVSTLDMTDPKSRSFLKEMLEMMGGVS